MMNADQVRAYVAARWPGALQSPVALAVQALTTADEADRAIGFARLQCAQTVGVRAQMRDEAMLHAVRCIEACDAQGIAYDEETLSFNVETGFPDLHPDECDEAARKALKATGRG